MVTSVVAAIGKIKVFEKKCQKIPFGWGMDDEGSVTDDLKKVQSGGTGSTTSSGSYKDCGLTLLRDNKYMGA